MSKQDHKYEPLPIPTYEEATSSRPSSTQSLRGPRQISDDAERQNLIGRSTAGSTTTRRNVSYHAPTVESGRSSYDSAFTEPELSDDEAPEEDAELRRDLEEMEVSDPDAERRAQQRARLRRSLQKRLASIHQTFSSLHLPSFPSLSFITNRLPYIPERLRPAPFTWPIMLRLLAIVLMVAVVYALVFIKIFSFGKSGLPVQYQEESVKGFVQGAVDPESIARYLNQVSYDDHVAGTKGDYFLAKYIEDHFKALQFDSTYDEEFNVYMNYPKPDGRRAAIIKPEDSAYTASLEERLEDISDPRHQVLPFHGFSRSGNVTGPLIYANYGAREDYKWLQDVGIDLKGSIVLVRTYGSQPDIALKVKAAELVGAVGCLVYSDPKDDPDRWVDSIQRASVALTSWILGDPLTPGVSSKGDTPRIAVDNNPSLVNIPSLPLNWFDAQQFLQSLRGRGRRVPENWVGGTAVDAWWTGDHEHSPVVNVMNIQDEPTRQPIRNIFSRIRGLEDPDTEIYVGNARDAWCFGASDPGSGTAVWLEVSRIFSELLGRNWRPRRSIVFASWDGAALNALGSTEHVEEHASRLNRWGLAYLDISAGVTGRYFHASANPLFRSPLERTLSRVSDPVSNTTVAQAWAASGRYLAGLPGHGDILPFADVAGVSSITLGFKPESNPSGVLGSCHDSLANAQRADPGWAAHASLAQIWALLLLELADEPIVPFDFAFYASEIARYVSDLQSAFPAEQVALLEPLRDAAELFGRSADTFVAYDERWRATVLGLVNAPGDAGDATLQAALPAEPRELAIRRTSHNARMSEFEWHLLDLADEGGTPGRTQYKHVVHGPAGWSGTGPGFGEGGTAFPRVRDALETAMGDGSWDGVKEQIGICAQVLHLAAWKLVN